MTCSDVTARRGGPLERCSYPPDRRCLRTGQLLCGPHARLHRWWVGCEKFEHAKLHARPDPNQVAVFA
jgi:hypothetical protein